MSTAKYPKHVQSMSWYRRLAQLYVLESVTARAASMTRQTSDRSEDIAQTVLNKVEQTVKKGVK